MTVLAAAALLGAGAHRVAPRLLGWRLRAHGVTGIIAEVEAYHSERDLACHASRGRTPRSAGLYRPAGTLYLYQCYGLHVLLNLVCDQAEVPSAVLIRGLQITDGEALARQRRGMGTGSDAGQLANGPGKVAQALGLDLRQHGLALGSRTCPLRLLPPSSGWRCPALRRGPRVGVAYAGPLWAAKPWRWWLAGFAAVRQRLAAAGQGRQSAASPARQRAKDD